MTVQNGTIKKGATGFTVVGGSDAVYTTDGPPALNGVRVAEAAVADFRVRPSITFKVVQPKYDGTSYTKGKISATLVVPKIIADGTTKFNLFRGETEIHPETTAAEALDIRYQFAQLLFDADYASLWSAGSTI